MVWVRKICYLRKLMTTSRKIGIVFLFLLWVWLSRYLLVYGGFNLKNLFLVVASGIIIFVPLWKKYIRTEDKKQ